jgi:protein-L-isoaspartate(D-aspartate) O-methyltransferase
MDKSDLYAYYEQLDRSLFLDEDYKALASVDGPLPIGYGQTISQPSLVVEMTRLLDPDENCSVLEIGTGSGYQTALLARFSHHVYTVEIIPELSDQARSRLDQLGFTNITYRISDGSAGWLDHAPYDRIMVTAAAGKIPDELVGQLTPGGRMIIPVGPPSWQELLLITKGTDGEVQAARIESVRFVELRGKYGWGY